MVVSRTKDLRTIYHAITRANYHNFRRTSVDCQLQAIGKLTQTKYYTLLKVTIIKVGQIAR